MKTLRKLQKLIDSNSTNSYVLNELLVLQTKIIQIKALNPQASKCVLEGIANNLLYSKIKSLCLKHSYARVLI
jgi:hypothetical protein